MSRTEGYVLTEEDCGALMALRATTAAMADFSRKVGADTSAQDFDNRVQWLDGFMDRIGATEMLSVRRAESSAYNINPGSVERDTYGR